MRTVHCSGCLLGNVCLGGVCLGEGGCLPRGVSGLGGVCLGVVCPGGGVCPGGYTPPPVERILDTRLWKHYLSATTVADGNHEVLTIRVKEVLTICNEKFSQETSENGCFYEKVLQVYDVWIGTALHHQASTYYTDPKLCR